MVKGLSPICIGGCFALAVLGGPWVVKPTTASNNPVLLTQANSTRAIALESPRMTREPFSIYSIFAQDGRTRITLFANNLELLPWEGPSAVKATAVDGNYQFYLLRVEYVGKVPEQTALTQIVLRLSDFMSDDTGDVFVQISYHGLASNSVRIGIGHVGDGPYVLEFDGSPKAVDYGDFWMEGVDLGHFFWEFWAVPGPNASERYLISDGYGGAHAILLGFSGVTLENAQYVLAGNVWDGIAGVPFRSDEGPAVNEWGHYAVGWDGTNIVTYFNGVPVGKTPFTGPRREFGPSGGGGRLLIGGSNHQNFIGKIWQVRGYENSNPREDVNGIGAAMSAFAPQTIFEGGGTLLSSFTRPTLLVEDRSGNNYVGRVRSTACGILGDCSNYPLPEFVIDSTAPSARPIQPATVSYYPPQVPAGALVFDSFSRRNSTYAFDGVGGLGSTQGGALGSQVWQYGQVENGLFPFGILNGRAVVLANSASAAWVSAGNRPADLEIRVKRNPGPWSGSGVATGLLFRFRDINNLFYAYTTGESAATQSLTVGNISTGTSNALVAGVRMPTDWTTLRVVTLVSGIIEVYADSTLVYSVTTSLLATEPNAGLWNSGTGRGLSNRWDDFTVLPAP